jgi:transposase
LLRRQVFFSILLEWLKRIRQAYHCHRERLARLNTPDFATPDAELRAAIEQMKTTATEQLSDPRLRQPCRKVLVSLQEHWTGLTRFVEDPRIPMDNNASERSLRGAALGRKNYYGSHAEWSGRLAMMLFSIFATLPKWNINPRTWLRRYLDACAKAGGKAPLDIQPYLPWNRSEAERQRTSEPIPLETDCDGPPPCAQTASAEVYKTGGGRISRRKCACIRCRSLRQYQ